MMDTVEEGFRRITIGDPGFVATMTDREHSPSIRRLDDLTEALLRIAAMIAVDAPPSSYRAAVEAAQRAGARLDDLFAVLLAVAGDVGSARIVSAAPKVALAAGYDVEAALE
jgi:4-carboxymuconolactone decarboxylase